MTFKYLFAVHWRFFWRGKKRFYETSSECSSSLLWLLLLSVFHSNSWKHGCIHVGESLICDPLLYWDDLRFVLLSWIQHRLDYTLDLALIFGYSFVSCCSRIPAFPFHVLLILSAKISIKPIKFPLINESGFGFLLWTSRINELFCFFFLLYLQVGHIFQHGGDASKVASSVWKEHNHVWLTYGGWALHKRWIAAPEKRNIFTLFQYPLHFTCARLLEPDRKLY